MSDNNSDNENYNPAAGGPAPGSKDYKEMKARARALKFAPTVRTRELYENRTLGNVTNDPLTNNTKNTRQKVRAIRPYDPLEAFYDPSPKEEHIEFFIEPMRELFHKKKMDYELELVIYYYRKEITNLKIEYEHYLNTYYRTNRERYNKLVKDIKYTALERAIQKTRDKFISEKYKHRESVRAKKLLHVAHQKKGYYPVQNLPLFRENLGNTLNNKNKFWVYKNTNAFDEALELAKTLNPPTLEEQTAAWESRAAEREAMRPPRLNLTTVQRRTNEESAKAEERYIKHLSKRGHNPTANEWVPVWLKKKNNENGEGGAAAGGEGGAAAGGEGEDAAGGQGGAAAGGQGGAAAGGSGGAAGGSGGAAGGSGGAAGGSGASVGGYYRKKSRKLSRKYKNKKRYTRKH